MSFLETHNLPATACFVSRYLSSQPDGTVGVDLPKLLAPPSLVGPAGKEKGSAGGLATKHTIRALKSAGLIVVRKSKMFVREPWRSEIESALTDREVLRIIRRAVLASQESSSCWQLRQDGWNTSGANDFLRAACWFLVQDPLGQPFAFGRKGSAANSEQLQRRQFKGERLVLGNATSWDDFERWACAFGIARRTPLKGAFYLVPDPAEAIAEGFEDALQPGKWYSISEALDHLAGQLPILGTGALRLQMREHIQGAPDGVGEPTEDAALSQAIIMLADKGFLEIQALSDAEDQRLLWDRPTPRSITQLRLLKGLV